ncbi:RNA-directed DNA polymerase (reverse transcriptase)-related family protein [Rhynchospora pubera]|uniref:RNA-directed DNA polymerase (Reverse transcriptase)-related family protein n=1 Tax=Rhynchospora pubera TaxID=906938 RepID=A0AAV8GLS3_9POAL|nr:RNA-directed DNA polymerase (reverse transcriptase)-related family protein [Rhynchospora pubera]
MYSSLFYADDAILFFKPGVRQAIFIKFIFMVFGLVSGLFLNSHKSDLLTLHCSDATTHLLASILNCKVSSFPIIYLGLPLSPKPLTRVDFQPLMLKFQNRLQGWSASLLSIAGRLVLVNSCLSSLPVYFMSVFKLPSWVIKRIDTIRRSFLWHGVQFSGQKKLILVSWDKVTKPKSVGGLGILNLQTFNQALLSKWLWKWSNPADSLWKSLVLHLQSSTLSLYPLNNTLSGILKNFHQPLSVGLSFQLVAGKNVLFWQHNWIGSILQFSFPQLFSFVLNKNISVFHFSLGINNPLSFFSPLLLNSQMALTQLQSLLLLIRSPLHQLPGTGIDLHVWGLTSSSHTFSTQSLYKLISSHPLHTSSLPPIWKFKIPPRFKVFLWLMFQDRIATLDNLQKRGWSLPNRCCLCLLDCESVLHLFNHCTFYQSLKTLLLSNSLVVQAISTSSSATPTSHLELLLSSAIKRTIKDLFAIFFFVIWRERCSRIFTDVCKSQSDLLQEVLSDWSFFSKFF